MMPGRRTRPYPGPVAAFYLWLRRHPRLVDGVLAAALAIPALAVAVAAGGYRLVPFALALVIPLVFRRDHPVAAFAIGVAVGAVQVLLDIHVNLIDVVILILLYTLAAYCQRRVSVAGLAVCLAGSAVAVARWAPSGLSLMHWLMIGSIMFAGSSLIAWVLGDSMRYRRGYYAALEDRAARLERERDAQAQIAAAAERARIARELHDVIAHNVSVMVVQADGASYALDSSPERTRQALGAIASTGRQALAEMRRMLGVLRSDDGGAGRGAAARHRPARRAARPDPGQRAGRLVHRAGGARAAARRAGPGGLPDHPGVADQHPQARRSPGECQGAAALLRGRADAADHRRRAGRDAWRTALVTG